MANNNQPLPPSLPSGFALAPLHNCLDGIPLRLCVLVRLQADPAAGPFVLLRELPGSRVYLGVICDAQARAQEWVEIWVQTLELRDLAFSGYLERLTNHTFDQRWRSEYDLTLASMPENVIATGMETANPRPVLVQRQGGTPPLLSATPADWQLCNEDALLESHGLPPYSTSPFRVPAQSPRRRPENFPGHYH